MTPPPHSRRNSSTPAGALRGATSAVATQAEVAEVHARQVDELQRALLRLCEENPLVLLVDDADMADVESLAVLAGISRRAKKSRLFIVLSTRDASSVPGSALALLSSGAEVARLAPLAEGDVMQLVSALFGQVPNTRRLGLWLHENGASTPAQCMDLLRGLLHDGQLKYARGTFVLPHDIHVDSAAITGKDGALGSIRELGATALRVAQVLSLQRERLSVEMLVVAAELEGAQVLSALEQLALRGIVRLADGHAWIATAALRSAIDQTLDEPARQACHLRIGRRLFEHGYGEGLQSLLVAANLLRGGDQETGEALIARAMQGTDAGLSFGFDAAGAVPLLEEILERRRAEGFRDEQNLSLLAPLTSAGYFGDYRKQCEHGDRAFAALLQVSGIKLAKRLSRYVGSHLGLVLGISWAFLRYLVTPRAERMATFRDSLVSLVRVATGSVAATVGAFDPEKAFAIVAELSPFAALPLESAPRVSYEFAVSTAEVGAGRNRASAERYARLAQALASGKVKYILPGDLNSLRLGSLFGRAQAELSKGSPDTLALAEELRLGHPFYVAPAESTRMGYYALRGEQDLADRHRELSELAALRNGMSWTAVNTLTVRATYAYMLTRNALGLLQSVSELERLADAAPNLLLFRDCAQAYLALLGGRPEDAIPIYESVISDPRHAWMAPAWIDRTHYAEALCRAGRHEDAKRVCLAILSDSEDRLAGDQRGNLPVQQLALAEAELGEFESARARLDACLKKVAPSDSPLLVGSLHRDRALVALLELDAEAFCFHLDAMSRRFHVTGNPYLIRQREELEIMARAKGLSIEAEPSDSRKLQSGERATDAATSAEMNITTSRAIAPPRPGSSKTVLD